MRPKNLVLLLFALISLAGCSTLSVTSDYDNHVNFSAWHTYRWQQAPDTSSVQNLLAANPLVYRRVRSAVDRELASKGYVLKELGPVDFTVSTSGYIRELVRVEPDPGSWQIGYLRGQPMWYRMRWGDPLPNYMYYEEGVLVIDLGDASRKELSWRGAVRGMVQSYHSPEQMQAAIDQAVHKLLSIFPPAPAPEPKSE